MWCPSEPLIGPVLLPCFVQAMSTSLHERHGSISSSVYNALRSGTFLFALEDVLHQASVCFHRSPDLSPAREPFVQWATTLPS